MPDFLTLEHLASVAYEHASAHEDGGAGLCVPVAVALGWALREKHGVTANVVRGSYRGETHWWLDTDEYRIDPTRHQFDDETHLLHYRLDDDYDDTEGAWYDVQATYPALWSREEVTIEAEGSWVLGAQATAWIASLLNALEAVPA